MGLAVSAGPRSNRTAHQHVVREHEVGPAAVRLGHRPCVPVDEQLELAGGHVGDVARLDPLVAVEDEHRQERADLGPHDADVRAEREPLRPRLLADDDTSCPSRPHARATCCV